MKTNHHKSKLSPKARKAFVEELALTTVALQVADAMHESGKTHVDLARELGMSPQRISQILSMTGNVTIRTLARVADATGHDLTVRLGSCLIARAMLSRRSMNQNEINLGDTVTWSSQAGGAMTTKVGVVVECVSANVKPTSNIRDAGAPRGHISFVVKVQPESQNPKRPKKPVLYWPIVSLLKKVAVDHLAAPDTAEQSVGL